MTLPHSCKTSPIVRFLVFAASWTIFLIGSVTATVMLVLALAAIPAHGQEMQTVKRNGEVMFSPSNRYDHLSSVLLQSQSNNTQGNDQTCIQSGPSGSLVCSYHGATYVSATNTVYANQYAHHDDALFAGPAWSYGNYDNVHGEGWRIMKLFSSSAIFAARGIRQHTSMVANCHAVGDCALIYGYGFGDGGVTAHSDEGHTIATLQGGENPGYFHGTWTGGPSTLPTLALVSGNNWTTDGTFLLDISKGTIAGTLAGQSVPMGAPFASYLAYLPVAGVTLPLTTAYGNIQIPAGSARAFDNPQATAPNGVAVTRSITLGAIGGTTPALVSGKACLAGSNYPEQVPLTCTPAVAGVQSCTLTVRNPNGLAGVFQGGVCGQYISFDANLAATGYRTSYYAFGSLTGSDLIYGNNISGDLGKRPLPDSTGSEAETTNAPDNGFHLYPGAEIVMNTTGAANPTLEPNAVNWAAGDAVEDPHFQTVGGNGLWIMHEQNSPTSSYFGSNAVKIQSVGPGVSGPYRQFSTGNSNPSSLYLAGGGKLAAPFFFSIGGNFGDYFSFDYSPQRSSRGKTAMFYINALAENAGWTMFDFPMTGTANRFKFSYDPNQQTFISGSIVAPGDGQAILGGSAQRWYGVAAINAVFTNVTATGLKALTGTRFVCVDVNGVLTSQVTACSGT